MTRRQRIDRCDTAASSTARPPASSGALRAGAEHVLRVYC